MDPVLESFPNSQSQEMQPELLGLNKEDNMSAIVPVGGEEGGGVSSLSPPLTMDLLKGQPVLYRKEIMIMRERRVNVMLPGRNTEEIRIFMEMSSTINNWEDTLREKEIRLRKEDQERNLRIERAKSLKGIWT